jgi:3-oxoadipate enol-lactonase
VPYAEVNGTKLYYELKGKGPAVVLIHGWSLNTEMWDPQFDEFSKRHKVLRYDVRGYGKSEVPDQSKPYTHHDDLKACARERREMRHNGCGSYVEYGEA